MTYLPSSEVLSIQFKRALQTAPDEWIFEFRPCHSEEGYSYAQALEVSVQRCQRYALSKKPEFSSEPHPSLRSLRWYWRDSQIGNLYKERSDLAVQLAAQVDHASTATRFGTRSSSLLSSGPSADTAAIRSG